MLLLCMYRGGFSMNQRTTIQIEHKTLEKLKKQRITKRETYDEIILRLMRDQNAKKDKVQDVLHNMQ